MISKSNTRGEAVYEGRGGTGVRCGQAGPASFKLARWLGKVLGSLALSKAINKLEIED